jgi:hypothetical protein
LEYEDTTHKPIYQKETKLIQRRETVDPAVINRDNDNFAEMGKSNSDNKLNEHGNLVQSDINVKPEVVIQDRERSSKRRKDINKNPLSVISSEMSPSRDFVDKTDAQNYNTSPSVNHNSSKFRN